MKTFNRMQLTPVTLLVIFLTFLLASCDQPQADLPAEISISWSEIDQAIGLEAGSILEVVLPYEPYSGCQWEAGFFNPTVLEPYGEPEISDAAVNLDAPQTWLMHFTAVGEGETELVLLLNQFVENVF